MIWTASELIKATGGTASGNQNWAINGIEIDSRKITDGDLFVGLAGDNHDGHDYASAAAKAGATAMICSRDIDANMPGIRVDDTLDALRQIGIAARDRSDAFRVAITGSVGKTGTKEMVAAVLSAYGACHASAGNFNNHIGAPLSLARMPDSTEYGVFELGMNHAGEIADLSPLILPHAAIITRIAASHIGHFKSLDDIADAKAEIFTGLVPTGGIAVINADDDYAEILTRHAREAGADDVFLIGSASHASHRIISIDRHEDGVMIEADCMGKTISFKLGVMAPHWAYAALFSLTLVQQRGLDLDPAIKALGALTDLAGRGQQHRATTTDGRRFTLIDESYNASPASMTAAIMSLGSDPREGRRVAILADMLELGDQSDALHRGLADSIVDAGINLLICFGPYMAGLVESLRAANITGQPDTIIHVEDADTAANTAIQLLAEGDLVLVKGSNGMKTGRVVSSLLAENPAPNGESHAA